VKSLGFEPGIQLGVLIMGKGLVISTDGPEGIDRH
jgi:hypothetical protein